VSHLPASLLRLWVWVSLRPALVKKTPAGSVPLRDVAVVRVIYGDTDQMGMVYYANYLRYFEVARNEYLRAAGANYRSFEKTHGLFLPVVEAHVTYKRPARYDDELRVLAGLAPVGAASARFEYEIRRRVAGTERGLGPMDDELLVAGHTLHACITADGRVVRIPAEMREALAAQSR
jgi:acyl-CoA thioester hydrolase